MPSSVARSDTLLQGSALYRASIICVSVEADDGSTVESSFPDERLDVPIFATHRRWRKLKDIPLNRLVVHYAENASPWISGARLVARRHRRIHTVNFTDRLHRAPIERSTEQKSQNTQNKPYTVFLQDELLGHKSSEA